MRGRGYIAAPSSHRVLGPRCYSASTAPSASLRRFEAPCFDQLQCEGCTGHALAQAIFTSLAAQGTPLPFVPSPLGIYTLARCIGRKNIGQPLADDGAMLSDAVVGISQWGIHKIGTLNSGGNTDVTPENVNAEPFLLDLEEDAASVIVGCVRVDPTDTVALRAAIASGSPVFLGGYVDSTYENWHVGSPPVGVPNEQDPNGGGHATVLVESFDDGTFSDLTSWGSSFGGDGGHVRVSPSWVAAQWDAYVVNARLVTS